MFEHFSEEELNQMLAELKSAYLRETPEGEDRERIGKHIRNLIKYYSDPLIDNEVEKRSEENAPQFPKEMSVAFAVCSCGVKEFIVDGSTQECQHCGDLMFRIASREYQLGDD